MLPIRSPSIRASGTRPFATPHLSTSLFLLLAFAVRLSAAIHSALWIPPCSSWRPFLLQSPKRRAYQQSCRGCPPKIRNRVSTWVTQIFTRERLAGVSCFEPLLPKLWRLSVYFMMGNCFGLEPSEPSLPEEDVVGLVKIYMTRLTGHKRRPVYRPYG